jgi:ABC-type multidrug transport system ATPase subunit
METIERSSHPRPETSPAPGSAAVQVSGLTVAVGAVTLLERLDLAIPAGALVAIAGGSGAGKTTLLEVMAGNRRPTTGTVQYGRPIAGSDAITPGVGVVPQDDIIHLELPLARCRAASASARRSPSSC